MHEVPASTSSWWYVFGSAATVILGLQVVTGILLALVYTPSASHAWSSLQFLDHNIQLGWFLRALHGWGSDFMIAIVLIHMAQVFLFGAYKFPRELTWIVGVFLLLLTLGMAFTGQVLRFDQDAYWGLGIGASILSRVPLIGGSLVRPHAWRPDHRRPHTHPILRAARLHHSRHPPRARRPPSLDGSAPRHQRVAHARPNRAAEPPTSQEYSTLTKETGIPFVPDAAWKDAIFAAAIMLAVIACALFFGPFGPTGQPDPTIIQTAPKPDFAFLWIFAVLAYLPPNLETPVLFIAPVLIIGAMLLLPLVAGEGEKHWSRRPVAVLMVAVIAVTLGVLHSSRHVHTMESDHECMDQRSHSHGLSSRPNSTRTSRAPSSSRTSSAANCHSIGGEGGLRGPALDSIATRMTEDQIIRQVLQGGGNMPAYGNSLSPSETTALVRFLTTLRGNDLAPAIDASRHMALSSEKPAAPAREH